MRRGTQGDGRHPDAGRGGDQAVLTRIHGVSDLIRHELRGRGEERSRSEKMVAWL